MKSRNKKKIKVFDGYRCIYPYIRSKWKRMMSNAINEDDDKFDVTTKQIYKKSEYSERYYDKYVSRSFGIWKYVPKYIGKHIGENYDDVYHKFCQMFSIHSRRGINVWRYSFDEMNGDFFIDENKNIQIRERAIVHHQMMSMTHEQIEHNKKVSGEFTKKITQLGPWFEEPYMKKHIMPVSAWTYDSNTEMMFKIYYIRQNKGYFSCEENLKPLKTMIQNSFFLGKMWIIDNNKELVFKNVYARIVNYVEHDDKKESDVLTLLNYKVPYLRYEFYNYKIVKLYDSVSDKLSEYYVNMCGKLEFLTD